MKLLNCLSLKSNIYEFHPQILIRAAAYQKVFVDSFVSGSLKVAINDTFGLFGEEIVQKLQSAASNLLSPTSGYSIYALLDGEAAAIATAGGYVNASKICNYGCPLAAGTPEEMALSAQIAAGLDTSGALTEQLIESIAARNDFLIIK